VLDYDWGPNFRYNDDSGVMDNVPPPVKQVIPTLVPKVDADGNDVPGIHTLLLRMPLGTYPGWNPVPTGVLKGQEASLAAGYVPFALTKLDRVIRGDPRPSLEERYGNRAGFVQAVKKATKELVDERFMLESDAKLFVESAKVDEISLP